MLGRSMQWEGRNIIGAKRHVTWDKCLDETLQFNHSTGSALWYVGNLPSPHTSSGMSILHLSLVQQPFIPSTATVKALCQSKGIKDEKVNTPLALRSLTMGQILSSVMVTRDILGMLRGAPNPACGVRRGILKPGWLELSLS